MYVAAFSQPCMFHTTRDARSSSLVGLGTGKIKIDARYQPQYLARKMSIIVPLILGYRWARRLEICGFAHRKIRLLGFTVRNLC